MLVPERMREIFPKYVLFPGTFFGEDSSRYIIRHRFRNRRVKQKNARNLRPEDKDRLLFIIQPHRATSSCVNKQWSTTFVRTSYDRTSEETIQKKKEICFFFWGGDLVFKFLSSCHGSLSRPPSVHCNARATHVCGPNVTTVTIRFVRT